MLKTKDGPIFGIQGTFLNGTILEESCLPLAKRYACLYCDTVFGLKSLLNQHYGEPHGKVIPDFADYLHGILDEKSILSAMHIPSSLDIKHNSYSSTTLRS
jgi:hypothetical protein